MKSRETFGSRLGFVLVSAGCAIGLGNVWKFPYICGEYGGAAFILIYLLFLVILGLPILTAEYAVGRSSRFGIAKAFDTLEPEGTKWHFFKAIGIAGNLLLMMFYTMVSGWTLYYAYKFIEGTITTLDPAGVAADFNNMLASPGVLTLWMFVALTVSCLVCLGGLQKGIEKITKILMIILILLMIVLAGHSLVLEGAAEGIKFYLIPDFSKIKAAGIGTVVFAAMSQAFFTLSIGIGSMEIFGSYLGKENTLVKESATVIALDTFVALMAGFIVIPACFAYNIQPDAGPSLLFITLPNVFNNMVGGRVWGLAFFIFMAFAALSTVIAVVENIIAFFMDQWNWERKKATIFTCFALLVLSMPAILGFNTLSHITPFGPGSGIMDMEDFLVSNNVLPLGSLLFVLFCTTKNGWGWDNFLAETNTGKGARLANGLKVYIKYILPIIIIGVYFKGYYDFFASRTTEPILLGLDLRGLIWMAFAVFMVAFIFGVAKYRAKKKHK